MMFDNLRQKRLPAVRPDEPRTVTGRDGKMYRIYAAPGDEIPQRPVPATRDRETPIWGAIERWMAARQEARHLQEIQSDPYAHRQMYDGGAPGALDVNKGENDEQK